MVLLVAIVLPLLLLRLQLQQPPHLGGILSTVTDWPLYVAVLHQLAAACHANIEVGDLLSERISVDAQQIGASGLISAGRIQRNLNKW